MYKDKVTTTHTANMEALKLSYKWFNPSMYNFFAADTIRSLNWRVKSTPHIFAILLSLVVNLLTTSMVIVSPMPWLILDSIIIKLGTLPKEYHPEAADISFTNDMVTEIRELDVSSIGDIAVKADVDQFVSKYKELTDLFRNKQNQVVNSKETAIWYENWPSGVMTPQIWIYQKRDFF
jgi:hypothetical protein